jgi:hypothetical protein
MTERGFFREEKMLVASAHRERERELMFPDLSDISEYFVHFLIF